MPWPKQVWHRAGRQGMTLDRLRQFLGDQPPVTPANHG